MIIRGIILFVRGLHYGNMENTILLNSPNLFQISHTMRKPLILLFCINNKFRLHRDFSIQKEPAGGAIYQPLYLCRQMIIQHRWLFSMDLKVKCLSIFWTMINLCNYVCSLLFRCVYLWWPSGREEWQSHWSLSWGMATILEGTSENSWHLSHHVIIVE